MTLSMALFAISDMFVKLVSARISAIEIVLVLGIFGTTIFAILTKLRGEKLLIPALLSRAMLWRSFGEIIGTMGFVTAVTRMPLTNASAIIQALPLFITLGAALFFGVPVGWRRWGAIIIGMLGVLLILRPGLSGFDINSLFALQAVVGLAIRDIATRAVADTVSSFQLSAYGFAVLVPTGIFLVLIGDPLILPTPVEAWQLGALVIVGTAAYYAITAAMRVGEITVVTPYRYTRLLFALAISYLVFSERPDVLTLTGAAIIILSGIYTLMRERSLASADTLG